MLTSVLCGVALDDGSLEDYAMWHGVALMEADKVGHKIVIVICLCDEDQNKSLVVL